MPNLPENHPIAIIQITPLPAGVGFLNFALNEYNIHVVTAQAFPPNSLLLAFSGEEEDLQRVISTCRQKAGLDSLSITYRIIQEPHSGLPSLLGKLTSQDIKDDSDQIGQVNQSAVRIKPIQRELISINHELYQAGFITAVGGNLSVRDPDQPDRIWITPGSIFKGSIQAEQLVQINLNGEEIIPGNYHASSEKLMHSQILKEHPEFNAVIHSHGKFTTILILADLPFLQLSAESCFVGEMKRIPFIKSGTPELGRAVAEAIRGTNAVLLQNHGIVVAGKSLRSAADLTMIIEENAEKIIMCYLLGTPPPALSPQVIEYYRKLSVIRG